MQINLADDPEDSIEDFGSGANCNISTNNGSGTNRRALESIIDHLRSSFGSKLLSDGKCSTFNCSSSFISMHVELIRSTLKWKRWKHRTNLSRRVWARAVEFLMSFSCPPSHIIHVNPLSIFSLPRCYILLQKSFIVFRRRNM